MQAHLSVWRTDENIKLETAMIQIHPDYIVDTNHNKKSVVLPFEEHCRMGCNEVETHHNRAI